MAFLDRGLKPTAKFMAPLTRRETTKDLEDPMKRIDQHVLDVLAVVFTALLSTMSWRPAVTTRPLSDLSPH